MRNGHGNAANMHKAFCAPSNNFQRTEKSGGATRRFFWFGIGVHGVAAPLPRSVPSFAPRVVQLQFFPSKRPRNPAGGGFPLVLPAGGSILAGWWRWGQEVIVVVGAAGHAARMKRMKDDATTVAELRTRVTAFVRERDWEQFHAPKNLSMALAAEAGELMEHFLWATSEESRQLVHHAAKRRQIEEEVADVVIYALEFANMTGIDVAAAIEHKLAVNAKKYPVAKARGRSEKYTEL